LCREHNCDCVFIKTPLAFFYETYFSYYNAFEDYCRDHDITFLYLNKLVDEIGLDFDLDYTDNVHMNWDGQVKFSSWLGNYIQQKYQIRNKKGQPEFSQWDEDYDKMMYYINNFWELYEERR
jgi:hypothetical protein